MEEHELWSWRRPDLVDLVIHRFPEPIAGPAAAFFSAVHEGEPVSSHALALGIAAAEATLQFAVAILLAEYAAMAHLLQDRERDPRLHNALYRLLTPSSDHLTGLGAWARYARELPGSLARVAERARSRTHQALVCPKLAETPLVSEGWRLVEIRNQREGHALVKDARAELPYLRDVAEPLAALWQSLSFFQDYELLVASPSSPGQKSLIEDRTGALRTFPRFWREIHPTPDPRGSAGVAEPEGRVFLAPRGDGNRALGLDPFLVVSGSEERALMLLLGCQLVKTGREGAEAVLCYVSTRIPGHVQRPLSDRARRLADGARVDATVAPLHVRVPSVPEPVPVSRLVETARKATSDTLEKAIRGKVFVADSYIDRQFSRSHVETWLHGEAARTLVLTGTAGAGKTSFVCTLARELLSSESSGRDLVLLLFGSDLPHAAKDLEGVISGKLDLGARDWPYFVQEWEKLWPEEPRPGRVVLLVDGIDRSNAPRELFQSLLGLVAQNRIRLLATIALPLLEGEVGDLHELLDRADVYRSADGPLGGRAVLLPPLHDDEVTEAYKLFQNNLGSRPLTRPAAIPPTLRAAMRNPLILRLACEQYNERELPPTEADVLVEYTNRHVFVDRATTDFVEALVARLLEGRERAVPVRDLLLDSRMREAILDETRGIYAKLLDRHVLSEHVRSTGDRYTAPLRVVEFTFDVALGYLMLAFDCQRMAVAEKQVSIAQLVDRYAAMANAFAPAGFALDLALRLVALRGEDLAAPLRTVLRTCGSAGFPIVARFLDWHAATSQVAVRSLVEELLADGEQVAMADRVCSVATTLRKAGRPDLAAEVAGVVLDKGDTLLPPRSFVHATRIVVEAARRDGSAEWRAKAAKRLADAGEVADASKRWFDKIDLLRLSAELAAEFRDFDGAEAAFAAALVIRRRAHQPNADERGEGVLTDLSHTPGYLGLMSNGLARAHAATASGAVAPGRVEARQAPHEWIARLLETRDAAALADIRKGLRGGGALDWEARAAIKLAGALSERQRTEALVQAVQLADASGWRRIRFQALYDYAYELRGEARLKEARAVVADMRALCRELGDLYYRQRLLRIEYLVADDSGLRPTAWALAHAQVQLLAEEESEHPFWQIERAAARGNLAEFATSVARYEDAINLAHEVDELCRADEHDTAVFALEKQVERSWSKPVEMLAVAALRRQPPSALDASVDEVVTYLREKPRDQRLTRIGVGRALVAFHRLVDRRGDGAVSPSHGLPEILEVVAPLRAVLANTAHTSAELAPEEQAKLMRLQPRDRADWLAWYAYLLGRTAEHAKDDARKQVSKLAQFYALESVKEARTRGFQGHVRYLGQLAAARGWELAGNHNLAHRFRRDALQTAALVRREVLSLAEAIREPLTVAGIPDGAPALDWNEVVKNELVLRDLLEKWGDSPDDAEWERMADEVLAAERKGASPG